MFKNLKRNLSYLLLLFLLFSFVTVKSVQAIGTTTPIITTPSSSITQMEDWARSKGATTTFISLARKYWNLAPKHGGIDPVVAYAQAAKETGFGRFGGIIDESFNNPCGLKTPQGGADNDPLAHQKFTSWDEGIMAHLDHLALYAGALGYPKASGQTYDPRHFKSIYNTVGNSVENLGGKWAPSSTYGIEIATMVADMSKTYRLAGSDRFETAAQISELGWTTSENVILSFGYDFPDALSGVPLGYIKNAPILLTEKNSIPKATSDEIKRLQAKNVYILGSTGVISKGIEDSLKKSQLNVIRLYGADRFKTAVAIGNEVMKNNTSTTAVIATALDYPDALAISPYASLNKYPTLFTQCNFLDPDTKNFLINHKIKNVIIPGSVGVVSAKVESELKSIGISTTRISGSNRYDTALKISEKYKSSFTNDSFITIGSDFPDGLTGGVLAAKLKSPLLFVEKDTIESSVLNHIKSKGNTNLYILGSRGILSDTIVKKIKL